MTEPVTPPLQQFKVQMHWPINANADARIANQVQVLGDGAGFYISFGHAAPPSIPAEALAATPDQVLTVPVIPQASIYLAPKHAQALFDALKRQLESESGAGA